MYSFGLNFIRNINTVYKVSDNVAKESQRNTVFSASDLFSCDCQGVKTQPGLAVISQSRKMYQQCLALTDPK